jgi:alkaline phosphatase
MDGRITRRELFRLGIAGAASVALTPFSIPQRRALRTAQVRNIIFMVSDGMSAGVPSLADEFGKLVRGKGSFWHQLLQDPNATLGFFDMASLDSLVTDSSSASSAWGPPRASRTPRQRASPLCNDGAMTKMRLRPSISMWSMC